ncbi:MAG: transcriptional regulator [Paracoccaceae bacterium]|nr:MAG: Crp/Fnr family transcriptional regulator [Alphaproteobacteria bacterium]GIX14907.1 MAG: transcriptional regulator [Paracoccaceae bacterium]
MIPDKSFLRQVHCLAALDDSALERFAAACRASVVEAGTVLMHKGEHDNTVFFILSGRARVAIYTSQGRLMHLEDALPGAVVGEIAAISNTVRSATVETVETSLVARMAGETFMRFLRSDPEIAIGLLRAAHSRLHLLTERFFENTSLPVQGRIHAELLRLCGRPDFVSNTARIKPYPTHEEIANRIGARRESVAREFSRMTKMGLLAKRGRELEIRNYRMLVDLARAGRRGGV